MYRTSIRRALTLVLLAGVSIAIATFIPNEGAADAPALWNKLDFTRSVSKQQAKIETTFTENKKPVGNIVSLVTIGVETEVNNPSVTFKVWTEVLYTSGKRPVDVNLDYTFRTASNGGFDVAKFTVVNANKGSKFYRENTFSLPLAAVHTDWTRFTMSQYPSAPIGQATGMSDTIPNVARCDSQVGGNTGCVIPDYTPTISMEGLPKVSANVRNQISKGAPSTLHRESSESIKRKNRRFHCPRGLTRPEAPDNSCDEYPFASSKEGGGKAPGGMAWVPASEQDAQGGRIGIAVRLNRIMDGEAYHVAA